MAIITFAQTKGGSGKTTTAMATIAEFVSRKQSVAALDLDPNQPLAIFLKRAPDLQHIAVSTPDGTKRVTAFVKELAQAHDHVVIDLMGASSNDSAVAMALSDLVAIPSQMSAADLTCGVETWRQAEDAVETTGRGIACAVLMTRTSSGAVRPRVEDHIRGQYAKAGVAVMRSAFGDRAAWKEMTYSGFIPNLHDRESNAALNFISIFDEMMEMICANGETK